MERKMLGETVNGVWIYLGRADEIWIRYMGNVNTES